MSKISQLIIPLFLAVSLLCTSGCVAIVAGGAAAGGTAYMLSDLEVIVEAPPAKVRSAIVSGTKSLGLAEVSGNGDELQGKYIYRTAADKKVTIIYNAESDNLVELKIRVGTFGDEAMASRIYQAIQGRL
jgi:hypothetical protein